MMLILGGRFDTSMAMKRETHTCNITEVVLLSTYVGVLFFFSRNHSSVFILLCCLLLVCSSTRVLFSEPAPLWFSRCKDYIGKQSTEP